MDIYGLHLTLPRGVPFQRDKGNREAQTHLSSPTALVALAMPEAHRPGKLSLLPLGSFNGQLVGYDDDRLQITVAAPRVGKTSAVLIPRSGAHRGKKGYLERGDRCRIHGCERP